MLEKKLIIFSEKKIILLFFHPVNNNSKGGKGKLLTVRLDASNVSYEVEQQNRQHTGFFWDRLLKKRRNFFLLHAAKLKR